MHSGNVDPGDNPQAGGTLNPLTILNEARKAVPAVNYALGLAGLGAAGAVITGIVGEGRAAITILALVLIGSVLLFVFARISISKSRKIVGAGIFLLWAVVIFFVIFLGFTVSAFSIAWPPAWARFLSIAENGRIGAISVGTVAKTFTQGFPDPESGKRVARAFSRDMLELSSKPMPITGDQSSTSRQSIQRISLIFLQGRQSLIKLQKIALPSNVRQIRGASHKRIDKDSLFEAFTWAFVRHGHDFVRLSSVTASGETHWPISGYDNKEFFLIAHYQRANILSENYHGYAGAEIDDLAGNINSMTFVIGSLSERYKIDDVYYVFPSKPPSLSQFNRIELYPATNISQQVQRTFGELIAHVRSLDLDRPELKGLAGVLPVWDESQQSDSASWTGFQFRDILHDLVMTLQKEG